MAERSLFTSESITMGHPDKVSDQISDGILDAIIAEDPNARVACETLVTTGLVFIAGEVSCKCFVDIPVIAREIVKEIGYDDSATGFDYRACAVINSLHQQSPDISQGVTEGEGLHKEMGAGDQGMMFGYACNETPERMPLPVTLSRRICAELARARETGELAYLRPDGKAQVTVEYDGSNALRVDTVVVSTQHTEDVSHEQLQSDVREKIVAKIVPAELLDSATKYHINPTGRFVVGGPHGDAGLTGRKIIADTYGGRARHGGGAFSGKDPSKVDRSAAYMARYVAKNVVAAGLADRCEVQLSYAIGVAEPISVFVDTEGTGKISETKIQELIREYFSLKPKGIIDALDLRRPIYKATARHGHFGLEGPGYPWEKTDKADVLRAASGV